MTHAAKGDLIEPERLQIGAARDVRDASGSCPWVELVEARVREAEGWREEVLVIDVEPDLPQDLVYEIATVERLSVSFRDGDRDCPVVTALREDFPRVPHLNWTPAGELKNLCVYEDPWSEVRLRWTGAAFLRHLAQWLSRTAVGELHGADQALEPFLFESVNAVVFPEMVFDDAANAEVLGACAVQEAAEWPFTLKLGEVGEGERAGLRRFYCAAVTAEPTAQEAMRDCPRNLKDLSSVLSDVGVNVWAELCARLRAWYSGTRTRRPREDDGVVLLVRLPRLREEGGTVESVQHLAFELHPIQELAIASGQVGSAGVGEEMLPLALGEVDEELAAFIDVVPMRAIAALDRAAARGVSGLEASDEELGVVLVGAGALGSRIHENLARMGWGRWTLVDKDILLPHNVARHRLGEPAVGFSKVRGLAHVSGLDTPHNAVDEAFLADAQGVERNEGLLSAYRDADLILDASTSIAVARFLGTELDSEARRASLFVNPAGRDAVMLMEDAERSVTLDALEAQYYRAVLCDGRLAGHISREPGMRYGAGCRDVTARLAQDDLAIAGGLLSRQVRTVGPEAMVVIWRTAPDGSVTRIGIPVEEVARHEHNGWGFVVDCGVLARAATHRRERLPNETGGVLIGYFDVPRKTVYVVDALSAPKDSVEHKTAFVRGYAGLREELDGIEVRSGGQVSYVGEWHSHASGVRVGMSQDDAVLLATIGEEMQMDGWPGVMMIVGEGGRVGFHTQEL